MNNVLTRQAHTSYQLWKPWIRNCFKPTIKTATKRYEFSLVVLNPHGSTTLSVFEAGFLCCVTMRCRSALINSTNITSSKQPTDHSFSLAISFTDYTITYISNWKTYAATNAGPNERLSACAAYSAPTTFNLTKTSSYLYVMYDADTQAQTHSHTNATIKSPIITTYNVASN